MRASEIEIPDPPCGYAVQAELIEEKAVRQLREQMNSILLRAHLEARKKKALLEADDLRVQITAQGETPCA